ncbi:MAG TPA: YfhO family protein [Planctomycetota bacterium]|nr:YfhO family protein [Planctomycetota bacterium]
MGRGVGRRAGFRDRAGEQEETAGPFVPAPPDPVPQLGRERAPAPLPSSLQGALLIALLALAFLWAPISRHGDSYYTTVDLLQSGSLLQVDPGHEPGNLLLSDPVVQMLPWLAFNRSELARGRMPLWNPYNGCGAPHLANAQSAVLSPFSLPFYVLGVREALIAAAFLKLFALGFFTFLFLKALGTRQLPALVGATAFMFSGHSVLLLAYPHSGAAAVLPAGLYFVERAVQRFAAGRPCAWPLAGVAIVLGLGLLAGQPEPFYFCAIAVGGYALVRLVALFCDEGHDRAALVRLERRGALLLLAAALGAGLGAVQVLPFLEYLERSAMLVVRSNVQTPLARVNWPLHAFPDLLGRPSGPHSLAMDVPPPNYEAANSDYGGLLVLMLAASAILLAWRDRRALGFGLFALTWIAFAYDLLGVNLLFDRIPSLDLAPRNRSQHLGLFAAAVCAAIALERSLGRRARRDWAAAGLTLVLAAGLTLLALSGADRLLAKALRFYVEDPAFPAWVRKGQGFVVWTTAAGAAAAAALWLVRGRLAELVLGCAVLAAIFAQTGWLLRDYNTLTPEELFYPRTPGIERLQEQFGRGGGNAIVIGEDTLPPEANLAYGVPLLATYDALGILRYERLYGALFGAEGNWRIPRHASDAALRLFGVSTVLSPSPWIDDGLGLEHPLWHARATYELGEIGPGRRIVQHFRAPRDGLRAVSVWLATYKRTNRCTLQLALRDRATARVLALREIDCSTLEPDAHDRVQVVLTFPPIPDSRGRHYSLILGSQDASLGNGNAVTAWATRHFGIHQYRWMHRVPDESEGLARPRMGDLPLPTGCFGLSAARTPQPGGLNFDFSCGSADLSALKPIGRYGAYRHERAPRFRTVGRSILARSEREAWLRVLQPDFDPELAVILSDAPEGTREIGGGAPGAVEVLSDEPGRVKLRAVRPDAGYLVLAQTAFPGWRARVDGVERPLLRANYAFTALELPAGEHVIELDYSPLSFRLGALLSLASAAAGALLLLRARRGGVR